MMPALGTRGTKRKTEETDGVETAAAARKKPSGAERELTREAAREFVRQIHDE